MKFKNVIDNKDIYLIGHTAKEYGAIIKRLNIKFEIGKITDNKDKDKNIIKEEVNKEIEIKRLNRFNFKEKVKIILHK